MKNERTQYRVNILDEHYSLVSDEPAELIFNAAHIVNSLMKEVALKNAGNAGVDIKKIAILAALQLASQLVGLKNVHELNAAKHVELINKMSRVLQQT